MHETIRLLNERKSVRAYEDLPVEREKVQTIIECAMRAPTAGGMMLYTIIEIADQDLKDKLAISCDNQPFIAKAPLVLLFALTTSAGGICTWPAMCPPTVRPMISRCVSPVRVT